MAVFRIERTRDYTVMSNHHLRDKGLSLKSKGLLSMMLSLPEDWNYTTRGLAKICKEGVDAIGGALRELEAAGYIVRHQMRDRQGRISDTEYVIYEQPQPKAPDTPQPDTASPDTENPYLAACRLGYRFEWQAPCRCGHLPSPAAADIRAVSGGGCDPRTEHRDGLLW